MKVILEMFFPLPSNVNIRFAEISNLIWRNYTIIKVLSTTKKGELIDKKKFTKTGLDKNVEIFVVYIAVLSILSIDLSQEVQLGLLLADKGLFKVSYKSFDYADIFSSKLAIRLSEYIGMNNNTIELEEGKQPFYGPIDSLDPLKLEILKTYIKTYQKTGFI